jgi:uncharacterized protein (TIGR02996 family)
MHVDDGRAAFEKRLVDDPADDTTRLVYADWLADRGEHHHAKYLREIRKSKFCGRVRRMGVYALSPYSDLPRKVDDVTRYWTEPPPDLSPRCTAVRLRLAAGWRLPPHLAREGYHGRAEAYGVYIWELFNVIEPLVTALEYARVEKEEAEEEEGGEGRLG